MHVRLTRPGRGRAVRSRPPAGLIVIALAVLGSVGLAGCDRFNPGPPGVRTVVVTPDSVTLTPGDTVRLVATLLDPSGDTLTDPAITVTWQSSNTTVATTDATGLVTARGEGTAVILVTSELINGHATITVTTTPVASVALTLGDTALYVGDTVRATATTLDAQGDTLTNRPIAWSSSDTSIATVGATGLITARAAGRATITATSEGQHASVVVTVSAIPVAHVVLTLDSTALYVGDTVRATATTLDAKGDTLTGRTVTWASSDTTVARVDTAGLITARAAGTATIFASSEGQRDSVNIGVTQSSVASVTVAPDSGLAIVGDTLRLTATVRDAQGNTLTGHTIAWRSSDTTVATVDATGLVTAYRPDTVSITAAVEGKVDTATFRTAYRFTQLASGGSSTCGLSPMGVAYCWGDNSKGQLGDGTTTSRSLPAPVQTTLTFTRIGAGWTHVCALTASGEVYCWGDNSYGQLGNGTTTQSLTPTRVAGGLTFTQLAVGDSHVCAPTAGGVAYCWGDNGDGELGDGTTTNRSTPTMVAGSHSFTQLAAGYYDSCGLATDGTAYCWGDNGSGAIGDGTTTSSAVPVAVTGGHTFSQLAAGSQYACGVGTDGSTYCWGDNTYSQLGDGTTTSSTVPVSVTGSSFTQITIAPGGTTTCGLDAAGAGFCWGFNADGELGTGTTTNSASPVAVSGGHVFSALVAGYRATCGVATNGLAYCWGGNSSGQLGDGTRANETSPVLIAGQQ